MRRVILVLPALYLLPPSAAGQEPLQLVKKVAAHYASLSKTSYDFEQTEVRESGGAHAWRSEGRMRVVGSGGKYRQEPLPSGPLYVSDGVNYWVYDPDANEYQKRQAILGVAPSLSAMMIAGYGAKSAKLLREETIDSSSGPVRCQVIEVDTAASSDRLRYSPKTYWIEADRLIVWKLSYTTTSNLTDGERPSAPTRYTLSFAKATIGSSVDESLFRFTPPADAVEVRHLDFGSAPRLKGKDTADFQLRGPNGNLISSASLRGRPVLLQFAPDARHESLLFLEMAHRALEGRGLSVLYVLPSGDKDSPSSEGYTVPYAIDPGEKAARDLGISRTATVLIDSDGKITFLDHLSRHGARLAEALQKIGAW